MSDEREKAGDALVRRRAEVAARVEQLRAELAAVRHARSENSDDDEHDPEGATMSQLWSQSSGVLDAALHDLDELDAALDRVRSGDYGSCARCARAIDPARLDALPAATLCIECARSTR